MKKDYIKIISDYITAGTPVIIYTVSNNTICVLRLLKQRYGVLPAAVCDGDVKKQGWEFHGLLGLKVLSPEEAIREYPNSMFFISSVDNRFQIMGELISSGKLSQERIINFEPIVKRKTCLFFEKSVCVHDNGDLVFCWTPGSPKIPFDNDYIGFANKFNQLRNSLVEACQNETLPAVCASCKCIKEDWYPAKPKTWWLNYFGKGICNFKCSYCCSSTHSNREIKDAPELRKTIDALHSAHMLSDFFSVVISTSGEPTLHPGREDFFKGFDGYSVVVNSNGSLFDEDLFALMDKEQVFLIVSVDSGTKETFEKAKGVDCFDKVKNNLIRYSAAKVGIVIPKYIVVPDVNDDDENVEGFVKFCNEIGVSSVIIAYDQHGIQPIPPKAANAIRKIKQSLKARKILCSPYTAYETAEYVSELTKVIAE
ncbi:MAG: radical SAM protein [Oscillospiraceae bacterium]|nr:radical SAM protein [Oscillospiraceae bacterium]